MSTSSRHHGPIVRAWDCGNAVPWAVRTLAQDFGGEGRHKWWDTIWQGPRDGDQSGGANQDGSPEPSQEDHSKGRASRAIGGRVILRNRHQCSGPAIGESPRRRGEARPLPRSGCPAGTCRWCGKRGGLVGMIPEALCGEAPKGQPVIRREHLVPVGGEDPKGHPMIHGCRRPHGARTSGKHKKKRGEQSGPLSSRLTRMGERRAVDRSRDNPHGEPAASGKA